MADARIRAIDKIRGTLDYCLEAINPFSSLIAAVAHEEEEDMSLNDYIREARDRRLAGERAYRAREQSRKPINSFGFGRPTGN